MLWCSVGSVCCVSLYRSSFVTVSSGLEHKKFSQVVVCHWVYRGSSYAVWNCKSLSVVKIVVLWCWGVAWNVQPFLSITAFFIIGASIDQEPGSINYWKYLVGSGILATCCVWSELCAHYFTCTILWVSRRGITRTTGRDSRGVSQGSQQPGRFWQ